MKAKSRMTAYLEKGMKATITALSGSGIRALMSE